MLAALTVSLAISASAQIITNGSFEEVHWSGYCDYEYLFPGSPYLLGWTVGGYVISSCLWQASHGDAVVQLGEEYPGLPGAGSIYQDVPTVAGVVYQVTFDMSGWYVPTLKTMTVTADGTSSVNYEYTDQGNTYSNMNWATLSYSFTASDASTRLMFASTTSSHYGPILDNVAAYPRAGMVCHTNNGSGQPRTLNLTEGWAFWAHTQHGDQMGACP